VKASRFVAKNAALLTLGLFSGRLLGFFIFRRLTQLEGTAGTGVWAASVDITSIFIVVANFGLGALVTREIVKARERTAGIFWAAVKIRLTLGLLGYGFILAYVHLTGFDELTRAAILVMALGILIEAVAMACDSVLQAHEKVQHQTISQIVSAVVYFGLAWWWLDLGHGVMGILWANVASRLARLLVVLPLMVRTTGPWRRGGEPVSTRWLMRLALPMFLATTFGIIAYKIDTVMILEMLGEDGAGIYGAGHRPLDLLIMLPNIFATALFPSLQRYRESGEAPLRDIERMAGRASRYLHLVIFPITVACVLGAAPLMRLLAPTAEFAPAVDVFRIVILGLVLNAANTIDNRVLLTMGREAVFWKLATAVMVTNVGLNLVLIPVWSWNGAAVATVVSQIVSRLLHVRYIHTTGLRIPRAGGMLLGSAALLAAWFAASALLQRLAPSWGVGWTHLPEHHWVGFVATALVTGMFYLLAAFGLRALRREDLTMIRELRRG